MFVSEEYLRRHFGLSPQEPTHEQMKAMFKEYNQLLESKKEPTDEDLAAIVKKHCTTYQQFKHNQGEPKESRKYYDSGDYAPKKVPEKP
ncbi:hypothetical protein ACN469_05085 [Corallococcus terminator]